MCCVEVAPARCTRRSSQARARDGVAHERAPASSPIGASTATSSPAPARRRQCTATFSPMPPACSWPRSSKRSMPQSAAQTILVAPAAARTSALTAASSACPSASRLVPTIAPSATRRSSPAFCGRARSRSARIRLAPARAPVELVDGRRLARAAAAHDDPVRARRRVARAATPQRAGSSSCAYLTWMSASTSTPGARARRGRRAPRRGRSASGRTRGASSHRRSSRCG